MSIIDRFTNAVMDEAVGRFADDFLLPVVWTRASVAVLPVEGASLSLVNDLMRLPLGASDDCASAAEMLQFTHGAGPCLEVYQSGRPIRLTGHAMRQRWPLFHAALTTQTPYNATASVPLTAADTMIGALDLYRHDQTGIDTADIDDAVAIARHIVTLMSTNPQGPIREELTAGIEPTAPWLNTAAARRRSQGWIAIGMLRGATDFAAPEALDVLRAYAWSRDLTVDLVASQLVSRDLTTEQLLQG